MNKVEKFIDEFLGGTFADKRNKEYLITKFTNGYCYYFACMLQCAFKRGEVCWAAPNNHFVWKDIDGTAYDINYKYDIKKNKTFYLIPEWYLGKFLKQFLHTEKLESTPKNEIIDVIKDYCKSEQISYDEHIEDWIVE